MNTTLKQLADHVRKTFKTDNPTDLVKEKFYEALHDMFEYMRAEGKRDLQVGAAFSNAPGGSPEQEFSVCLIKIRTRKQLDEEETEKRARKFVILKNCATCEHSRFFAGAEFDNTKNGHRRIAVECAKGNEPFLRCKDWTISKGVEGFWDICPEDFLVHAREEEIDKATVGENAKLAADYNKLRDLVRRMADQLDGLVRFCLGSIPYSELSPMEGTEKLQPLMRLVHEARAAVGGAK